MLKAAIYRLGIALTLFIAPLLAGAQQRAVKGVVLKATANERVPQVLITNLATNKIMMSDELGAFSITASPGDTLSFTKAGFEQFKMATPLTTEFFVRIWPVDGVQLNEVRVYGKSKKQELNEVMRDYRAQGTFYNGSPPALSFLSSPITGLYELFGKTPGRAKHFSKFIKAELEQDEINKRYNKAFVMRTTGLKTQEEAQKFMDYYSPSYEDIKQWNDYDLIQKTKRQFEYYEKNKEAIMHDNPFGN